MTENTYTYTVMLLNTYKNLKICIIKAQTIEKIDVETQLKKLKIKSLVAWLISEGRMDQKQIIDFVQPIWKTW